MLKSAQRPTPFWQSTPQAVTIHSQDSDYEVKYLTAQEQVSTLLGRIKVLEKTLSSTRATIDLLKSKLQETNEPVVRSIVQSDLINDGADEVVLLRQKIEQLQHQNHDLISSTEVSLTASRKLSTEVSREQRNSKLIQWIEEILEKNVRLFEVRKLLLERKVQVPA